MISELDKALKLEEEYLYEIALSRTEAMDRCISLGEQFIEHFDEIYKEPNCQAVDHWCSEMQTWFNKVRKIVLKHNNKKLNRTQMRDWFFTFGYDPSMYFDNRDETEAYEEFIDELEDTGSVEQAIKSVL